MIVTSRNRQKLWARYFDPGRVSDTVNFDLYWKIANAEGASGIIADNEKMIKYMNQVLSGLTELEKACYGIDL